MCDYDKIERVDVMVTSGQGHANDAYCIVFPTSAKLIDFPPPYFRS